MYNKIAAMLDKVADRLESKGLIREAVGLDVIANTLEKFSYTSPRVGHFSRILAIRPISGAVGASSASDIQKLMRDPRIAVPNSDRCVECGDPALFIMRGETDSFGMEADNYCLKHAKEFYPPDIRKYEEGVKFQEEEDMGYNLFKLNSGVELWDDLYRHNENIERDKKQKDEEEASKLEESRESEKKNNRVKLYRRLLEEAYSERKIDNAYGMTDDMIKDGIPLIEIMNFNRGGKSPTWERASIGIPEYYKNKFFKEPKVMDAFLDMVKGEGWKRASKGLTEENLKDILDRKTPELVDTLIAGLLRNHTWSGVIDGLPESIINLIKNDPRVKNNPKVDQSQ